MRATWALQPPAHVPPLVCNYRLSMQIGSPYTPRADTDTFTHIRDTKDSLVRNSALWHEGSKIDVICSAPVQLHHITCIPALFPLTLPPRSFCPHHSCCAQLTRHGLVGHTQAHQVSRFVFATSRAYSIP